MITAPTPMQDDITIAPFGTRFGAQLTSCEYRSGQWAAPQTAPLDTLALHPASHVLHYGSACFEGLKAYRWPDGSARLFRLDRHVARLQRSAELLSIPCPSEKTLIAMITTAVRENHAFVPAPPGSLYLRPTLIGTTWNIGAAGSPSEEALFFVLTSPVGNYFSCGERALRILIDEKNRRTPPGLGEAKTGGSYAAALHHTICAKMNHNADQVLFCPDGDVQETGASNFFLINDREILTKPLDSSFLHGVTRDSVLRLGEQLQYRTIEKDFTPGEILDWIERGGEAALSGTAAVMTSVGTFIYNNREIVVGDGRTGPNTRRLRDALLAIQHGASDDPFAWMSAI